jgi:tRNA-dihydrouridine synthase
MSFLDSLPKPFFVLAPMDDVTDTIFRQVVSATAKYDLAFTEFVNVDGLQSPGRPKLIHKLLLSETEKPVVAQLWGLNPENFYKTTKEVMEMGFAGVDLNFGCPVKTVVKNGACAAMIKTPERAGQIIDAVQAAVRDAQHSDLDAVQGNSEERTSRTYGTVSERESVVDAAMRQKPASSMTGSAGQQGRAVRGLSHFPVSVKTRVGYSNVDMSWPEFLLNKKLNLLSIHGRTAVQMSSVPADWNLIGQVREMRDSLSPSTLIVGNGDVESRAQAEELAAKYKLDGVMIGRGIFNDPFIFSKDSPWRDWSPQQKLELFQKHIELHLQTYKQGERRFETLRKFCKVYINGFDGAHELRARFMETSTPEEALALLRRGVAE